MVARLANGGGQTGGTFAAIGCRAGWCLTDTNGIATVFNDYVTLGAGETVFATALTRDSTAAAIEGLPLTAILKRPDGVEYTRQLGPDLGAGGHVFALPVAGTAPRGVWRLEVLADVEAAPLATKTFLVEDFLPERIDFDLILAETPIRLGDAPALSIDARYLFGAPGADLAIALALASAAKDVALPVELVATGEISLSGDIRAVTAHQLRATEANRLGFTTVLDHTAKTLTEAVRRATN
jgi:hypothetical protein